MVANAVIANPIRVRKGVELKLNAFWILSSWLAIHPVVSLKKSFLIVTSTCPTWTWSTMSCICFKVLAFWLSPSSSTSPKTSTTSVVLPPPPFLLRVWTIMFLRKGKLTSWVEASLTWYKVQSRLQESSTSGKAKPGEKGEKERKKSQTPRTKAKRAAALLGLLSQERTRLRVCRDKTISSAHPWGNLYWGSHWQLFGYENDCQLLF